MAWGALVFYCADGNWCCPDETNSDCCSTSSFWLAKGDPTIFGVVQSTGFSATASSEISSLPAAASTTVSPAPGTTSDLVPSLVLETISTGPPTALPPHSAIPMYTGSGDLLQGYCATPDYVLLDGPTVYWPLLLDAWMIKRTAALIQWPRQLLHQLQQLSRSYLLSQ
jgi:hypothetical protein